MNINKIRLLDKNKILIVNRLQAETNEIFIDEIAMNLENGIKIVLLKTEGVSARTLLSVGKLIRELCSIYNSIFIVESRIDIALLVHADGIHLSKEDIEEKDARNILGENIIVGFSVEDEFAVNGLNVDYITAEKEIKNSEIPCYIRKKENNKIIYKKN